MSLAAKLVRSEYECINVAVDAVVVVVVVERVGT